MKKITQAHTKFFCLIITVILLMTVGCSDSTGPGKNNGNKPQASATIGTSGGTVKTGQITVTVPQGAFTDQTTVGLTTTAEKNYGENAVSSTFKISGIPTDFKTPLTISVTFKGTLSKETYIAVGENITEPLLSEPFRLEHFYPVVVSDSILSCTLPPHTLLAAKRLTQSGGSSFIDLYITALTNYVSEKKAPHFPFTIKEDYVDYSQKFGAYMEGVYKVISNLGFDYHLPGNEFGTLDSVSVGYNEDYKDLPPLPDPPVFSFFYSGEPPLMFVDAKYAQGSLTYVVKHDAAQTFMLMVSRYYTKSNWVPFSWFDLAFSDWIARYINGITDEVPLPMAEMPTATFQGIPISVVGEETSFFAQARSFSPLVEYFNKKYKISTTDNAISSIYNERYNGKNLSESLETVLGDDESVWWPEFIKEYITGNIYNLPASSFTSSEVQKGKFTVTSKDTTKTFSGVFGDLAADIYTISIDPTIKDKIGTIRFNVDSKDVADEYLSVLLFGIKGGKLEYIGRGVEFSVTGLTSVTDNNTLLAVVENSLLDYPFNSDNDYSLTVTAVRKTGVALTDLKNCRIVIGYFYQENKIVYPDGKTELVGGKGGPRTWNDIEMTLSGNVFTGKKVVEWTGLWGNSTETIDYKVTVSGDLQTANLEVLRVSDDHDNNGRETETFSFWNLPAQNPANYACRVAWGTSPADYLAGIHLENISYTYLWESTNGSSDVKIVNALFYCTGVIINFF